LFLLSLAVEVDPKQDGASELRQSLRGDDTERIWGSETRREKYLIKAGIEPPFVRLTGPRAADYGNTTTEEFQFFNKIGVFFRNYRENLTT